MVTTDIISKVLHVPRLVHLDYLDCDRLRTASLFCETPSV